jgi:transposase
MHRESLLFRSRVDETLPASPGSGPQLSHEASHTRCDTATTTVEQRHRRVIALLVRQMPIDEIATATGYSSRWVRKIAHRYRTAGPVALGDLRHHNTGAEPLLSVEQQYELQQAFQHPPPDGGEWTGPKVAHWIEAKTGQRVHRQRGWEYLRRLRAASPPL